MHLTWLDNNSWLIEMGQQRILLDPWLVGDLVFGQLTWLFKGSHPQPRPIPDSIDLILLSQGLEDHAHPPTLQQLDRQIPVVASANAARVVQGLGYTQVSTLQHGESLIFADRIQIQALPGSSIGPTLIENGYLLTDLSQQTKLYYEPHGSHSPALKAVAPVDVVITPMVDLQIPLVGSIVKGSESALQAVEWLQPQVVLPTAAGGDATYSGILMSVLQTRGSVEEFRQRLVQQNRSTQVLTPRPGERIELGKYLTHP